MSLISRCPKCHQQVTILDGLDPEADVRCPLCVVVYPLREALAEVPPALIPVDTGAIQRPSPESDALAKSDLITERFHVPESDAVSPAPQAEGGSADDEAYGLGDGANVDMLPETDTEAADGTSPVIDTGQTPVDAEALAAFGLKALQREHEAAAVTPAKLPPRRKEKSGLRFVIEVFAGGLLGLTIGYYALCWILGPRHGLPELPLPLLPHTMHWFSGAQHPDNPVQQPAAGQPGTSKQPELEPRRGPPPSEQNSQPEDGS
jgi:hypothetical protein